MKDPKQENRDFNASLTQEEMDAPSYLDWSNERLGEFVRVTANYLKTKTIKGYESVTIMAALFLITSQVDACNAGEFEVKLTDVTSELHPEPSDWLITVKKLKKARTKKVKKS